MNVQTEPIAAGETREDETRKELKKQVIVAVCGTALTLATLAAIGAWSASGGTAHGGRSRAAGPQPFRAVASVARPVSHPTYYYLVASQEQANRLELEIDSDAYVAPEVVARNGYVFVVVNSPEDEARARLAVDEGQNSAAIGGEPGPQLVDLRTP